MATAAVIAFKKQVLHATHVTTYNQLSSTPKTVAAVAASEGTTDQGLVARKLALLADEGLAVQVRSPNNPDGATLNTFQLS